MVDIPVELGIHFLAQHHIYILSNATQYLTVLAKKTHWFYLNAIQFQLIQA